MDLVKLMQMGLGKRIRGLLFIRFNYYPIEMRSGSTSEDLSLRPNKPSQSMDSRKLKL
jgi:hypothetical protein